MENGKRMYFMPKCEKCGEDQHYPDSRFCSYCGSKLVKENIKEYSNDSIDKASYKITMTITERFRHRDHLEEEIRHTRFGEGGDLKFDSHTVERLDTLVPKISYPFICNDCHYIVSNSEDKWCSHCDTKNWTKR